MPITFHLIMRYFFIFSWLLLFGDSIITTNTCLLNEERNTLPSHIMNENAISLSNVHSIQPKINIFFHNDTMINISGIYKFYFNICYSHGCGVW